MPGSWGNRREMARDHVEEESWAGRPCHTLGERIGDSRKVCRYRSKLRSSAHLHRFPPTALAREEKGVKRGG